MSGLLKGGMFVIASQLNFCDGNIVEIAFVERDSNLSPYNYESIQLSHIPKWA